MVGIEAEAPVRKEEAETEMEHIIFMLEPGKKYRESILRQTVLNSDKFSIAK